MIDMLASSEHGREVDPPGFSEEQIAHLADLARNHYDQRNGTLASRLGEHSAAARYLCTTAARFLYLRALNLVRPDLIPAPLPTMGTYFFELLDAGYYRAEQVPCELVGEGLGRSVTNYCRLDGDGFSIASRPRDGASDAQLMTILRTWNPPLALLRDGTAKGGSHTLLAVRDETGSYRLIDTFFRRNGDHLAEHFGPGRPRWLWHVFTWHRGAAG